MHNSFQPRLGRFLAPLLAALLAPSVLAQSTWIVDIQGTAPGSGTSSDPFTSIQYAIEQSATQDGDTVLVRSGTYAEAVDFSGKRLVLASMDGASLTSIESSGSVVRAISGEPAGTEIAGFTIRGGTGTLFTWNPGLSAVVGGGVYSSDSHLVVRECRIVGNSAEVGGGVYHAGGELQLIDTDVITNVAERTGQGPVMGGGVACSRGSLILVGCAISGNTLDATGSTTSGAPRGGGVSTGLIVSGAPPTLLIRDCMIENNRIEPSGRGGGIFIASLGAQIEQSIVRGNSTGSTVGFLSEGAGIYVLQNSQVALIDVTIEGNGSGTTRHGGGLAGSATLDDCTIRGNQALLGGGVFAPAGGPRAILTDCVIEANIARLGDMLAPKGAGAHHAELIDCVLRDNRSSGSGGAAADSILTRCEIRGNSAGALLSSRNGVRGGALVSCTAVDCTIAENSLSPCFDLATDGGGAAYDSTLTRCLIIGNSIDDPGLGAATQDCDLDNCTVWGNEYLGGWGYSIDGAGTVRSTIIFGNVTNIDIDPYAPTPTLSYCDVEQGIVPGAGNISSAPEFWAPDRFDFHLRPGSPCIDAGDPTAPVDPDGSTIEIGAIPFDSSYYGLPTNYCTAKENSLGCFARMDFAGSPTLTGPDDFVLTASGLPAAVFAIPVWSLSAGNTPLGGGTLCVGMPFTRGAVALSGSTAPGSCVGASIASPFTQATMGSLGLGAGSRVFAQMWYRDAHPDGTGFSLTDGLDFTVRP